MEEWFIEQAVIRFVRYAQPALLIWAIENSLPGLLKNEAAKQLMKRLVSGSPVRRKGVRPSVNLGTDDLTRQVGPRVWFYIGTGLPAYVNPESLSDISVEETACGKAAAELNRSAAQIYKIWHDKWGGREPKGSLKLVAVFWQKAGEQSVKSAK